MKPPMTAAIAAVDALVGVALAVRGARAVPDLRAGLAPRGIGVRGVRVLAAPGPRGTGGIGARKVVEARAGMIEAARVTRSARLRSRCPR
jgi:hypothetical protein